MRKTKRIKDRSGDGFKKVVLSKSYRRNLDVMKLLVTDPDFKIVLARVRERLKIPPEGFGEDDNDKLIKWNNWLIDESDTVLNSTPFTKQEITIKDKFRKRELTRRMTNKQLGLLYEKMPLQFLHSQARFVADKFHLPLHFISYIELYFVGSVIDAPRHNYESGQFPPGKLQRDERYIPIKIYSRLTNDEMKELRHYIEWAAKDFQQYQPLQNIDRKLEIEKWYENRERTSSTDETYNMTNEEIAESLLGDRRLGKKVYDVYRGIKRLRNVRFRRSEKKRL